MVCLTHVYMADIKHLLILLHAQEGKHPCILALPQEVRSRREALPTSTLTVLLSPSQSCQQIARDPLWTCQTLSNFGIKCLHLVASQEQCKLTRGSLL